MLYVGAKYGEDIANELNNKAMVTIPPPTYSDAIRARHIQWELLVRKKQVNMLAALKIKLIKLKSKSDQYPATDYSIEIAELENKIDEAEYKQAQQQSDGKNTTSSLFCRYNSATSTVGTAGVKKADQHAGCTSKQANKVGS